MKKIDWHIIKTATGTAVNIIEAFELLKSNSLKDREKGYWLIDNHAVLQSDLYEAAYYVIDPLVELLYNLAIEKKSLIVNLLIEIAYGCAPTSITININDNWVPLEQACHFKLKSIEKEIESLIFKIKDGELKDNLNLLLKTINSFE